MASSLGQTPNHLIDTLENRPFSFDFFRAVRLLQAHFPQNTRIGYSYALAQDPIRFAQAPSLVFAPSTISSFGPSGASGLLKLFVNHFGLWGPNGPMPLCLTEYLYERQLHHDDYTLAAFTNIFHHRLLSFFFRAWADNQKTVDLDRREDQHFAAYIGSFFGMATEPLQNRDEVQDAAKLFFAGRLANQARNAEGLEAILQEYFGIKTEVDTFVGRWMNLPEDTLCRLGESPDTGSLGLTSIVGSRFWEAQLAFRITLGPMTLADYERLLPGGIAFSRLRKWVLNYCGEHFVWDARFILLAAEVPEVVLGRSGRLGWTSWLKTQPFKRDADDLVLSPPNN
jgi:type VI secretion system protein ImpH